MRIQAINNGLVYNRNNSNFKAQEKTLPTTRDKVKDLAMYTIVGGFFWNHFICQDMTEYVKGANKSVDKITRMALCLGTIIFLFITAKEDWEKWSK